MSETRTRLNVAARLAGVPQAQHGYFTRAQAAHLGVEDFALARAVQYDDIERVGTGVYRVTGAGHDEHAELRVMWLRLAPESDPLDRISQPTVWVSHESAAELWRFGTMLADIPTFIVRDRHQIEGSVRLRRRRTGIPPDEWDVVDGITVTSPSRTLADLANGGVDGGHLGRYVQDAIAAGVSAVELDRSLGKHADLSALIAMAETA